MASIDRRPDGLYRARWREHPGAPQKTRQFTRKRDAEHFLDSVRGDLAHGPYVDPAGGRTLFRDYAEQWRAARVHRGGTATQIEINLRLHAYPSLGGRQLGAIRRSDIQAWVKELTGGLAPRTVELNYRWVATIFKAAVGDRLIASSPCVRIGLPKRNDAEVVPLNVSEVEALVGAVPDRFRALIVFAAGMGLRQGECFGLTVDRVDFLRRTVRVDRQLLDARDGIPGVRSAEEQGRVPHRAHARRRRLHARRPPRPVPAGAVRTGVTNSLINPLRRNTVGAMWHRAAAKSGLPEWATFHDLRHFYASLLIAQRCSVKVVQRRLGHQSATETLDIYGHLWPDSEDETRNAVDHVLAGLAAAG